MIPVDITIINGRLCAVLTFASMAAKNTASILVVGGTFHSLFY